MQHELACIGMQHSDVRSSPQQLSCTHAPSTHIRTCAAAPLLPTGPALPAAIRSSVALRHGDAAMEAVAAALAGEAAAHRPKNPKCARLRFMHLVGSAFAVGAAACCSCQGLGCVAAEWTQRTSAHAHACTSAAGCSTSMGPLCTAAAAAAAQLHTSTTWLVSPSCAVPGATTYRWVWAPPACWL